MLSLSLSFFVVICSIQVDQNRVSNEVLRVLAAFASFFTMIKFFDWLRLFEGTAFYIRLIMETLADIGAFLLILVLALLTFGIPMYMLDLNRSDIDDNHVIDPVFGFWGMNALLNQYFLSLGEFSFDNFADNPQSGICYFFFLLSTFLTQITMLNMLIAIMGDTYSRIMENKDVNGTMTKLELMADAIHAIKTETDGKDDNRFLFVVKPDENANDEDGDWSGAIAQLSRTVQGQVGKLGAKLNRKMDKLQTQNDEMSKRSIQSEVEMRIQIQTLLNT